MKNLLLSILLLSSMATFSQASIFRTSFNDSVPIGGNSTQWVDLGADTSVLNGTDSVRVFIEYNHTHHINMVSISIADYTHLATDSVNHFAVHRITFQMPAVYVDGIFTLYSQTDVGFPAYGLFSNAVTGLTDIPLSQREISAYRYYDMSGREMLDPSGLCIQETVYRDDTLTRGKVFKQ